MRVPPSLAWWRDVPGGAEWLERLPALAAECAERWSLRLGEPLAGGNVSLVLAAEAFDGTPAVLKLNFPEPESEHEPDALAHWGGRGAVHLLDHDAGRRALLLERAVPGTSLWQVEDDERATRIAAGVLERLWRPPPPQAPFRLLAAEAERWAEADWRALGGPYARGLLDEAVAACRELGPTQGPPVVLHQDFHGGNVLRATRAPWLAIDPKPLLGEREFDAASLLRDRRWELGRPGTAARLRRRLDLLSDELGLDRGRTRGWAIVHALAWGVSGAKLEPDLLESARLLAAAR